MQKHFQDSHRDLIKALNTLAYAFGKADLEDFELDKCSEFSSSINLGRKNILRGQFLMALFEAINPFNVFYNNFFLGIVRSLLSPSSRE